MRRRAKLGGQVAKRRRSRRQGPAQIETSFLTVKQEFALEKARARTFRRLENIFALRMLAYVFMIGHIRGSRRFKRIVKALSDNAAAIALKTHSLLAGIRTLASKVRICFISGSPRTRGRLLPGQLTLDLRVRPSGQARNSA